MSETEKHCDTANILVLQMQWEGMGYSEGAGQGWGMGLVGEVSKVTRPSNDWTGVR